MTKSKSRSSKRFSIPKFVYNPNSTATTTTTRSPLAEYTGTHFAAAQYEFYHEFQEALSDVKRDNTTKLDAIYLTFQGFQYMSLYSRSSLVLNFKYETVLSEREPKVDSILCIVMDKKNRVKEKVKVKEEGSDWEAEEGIDDKYWLIWGMVSRVTKDLCESKTCCVELISEITSLETHKVLLKLTTTRKPILAMSTNKHYVQFSIMKEMGYLETDLNAQLTPILLSSEAKNKRPHYLKTVEVEKNFENLNTAQIEAVDWCLNHKISIVQGPPGTGKSHLALRLIKMLSTLEGMRPILFITVKNAVLDNALQKLINMKVFDKERILRLGQRYDKKLKDIEDISVNSDYYNKLRDEVKTHKAKNLHRVYQDLDLFRGKSEEIFQKVDECRTMDLYSLWEQFTNHQKENFLNYAAEWHSQDVEWHSHDVPGVVCDPKETINFRDVETALDRWCPDKDMLRYYKESEGVPSRVVQIPDERKVSRDLENEEEGVISVDTKVFQIADTSEYRSFHMDDFPHGWRKMTNTKKVEQLWDLEPVERLKFIYSLMYRRLSKVVKDLDVRDVEHFHNSVLKQKYLNMRKGKIFQNFSVIATTVHGALLHKQALSKAGVVTVVCEEASQVSERELLVSLPTSTLHVIMIGDYKQLPPFCNIPSLQDCSTSLMTRMVTTNYPFTTLKEQFRMTPEIAALLTATYPDLVTVPVADPAERHLPETFIKYPLFWWIHESYEYKGISPCNEAEAEKVCALAKYLLLHGIEERRITIIAGYQGQVTAIKEILKKRVEKGKDPSKLLHLQIRTIDSYQGSENDVVLLTLTRNNPRNAVGFMDLAGRRCVALSRARLALYIVGSRTSFKATEWNTVIDNLESKGMMEDTLPLVNEKGEERDVKSAKELYEICDLESAQGLGNWDVFCESTA